jgi:hypothetical protein
MNNIFTQMAERARAASRAILKPKPDDDGPQLEMTIPMPEVGIGDAEHLENQREEREAESKRVLRAEMKSREYAARQSGDWAELPSRRTPTVVEINDIGKEFKASGLKPVGRSEEEERQMKRDRGMSM